MQLDSDLSVNDVEPGELDQYLNRRSVSPSRDSGETTRTSIRADPPSGMRLTDAVGRDPPSITSPEATLGLGGYETESGFFDLDFSNSALDSLSGITSSEGRLHHASSALLSAASRASFVGALTGNSYCSRILDVKPEVDNATMSPIGPLLSVDEVQFEPLRTPRAVCAADEEEDRQMSPDNIREMPTFPTSDCGE